MSSFMAKQFVVLFIGWLILQVLSPDEWRLLIGPFLTTKSLVMFLLAMQQVKNSNSSTMNVVAFFLMVFVGYVIVYGGEAADLQQKGKLGKGKGGNGTAGNASSGQ